MPQDASRNELPHNNSSTPPPLKEGAYKLLKGMWLKEPNTAALFDTADTLPEPEMLQVESDEPYNATSEPVNLHLDSTIEPRANRAPQHEERSVAPQVKSLFEFTNHQDSESKKPVGELLAEYLEYNHTALYELADQGEKLTPSQEVFLEVKQPRTKVRGFAASPC
jgi:hypothetical protein